MKMTDNKMFKRLAVLALSVILACSLAQSAVCVYAADDSQKASVNTYDSDSDTGISWQFDEGTGVLTISGTGTVPSYMGKIVDGVSVEDLQFYSNRSITKVVIEDGVTGIDEKAFWYCYNLESVSIADSVVSIGRYAFYYCSSLTSITLPEGLDRINNDTFEYSGLVSISIPDSVKYIGQGSFSYCADLETVVFGSGLQYIGDMAFGYCESLTSVSLPYGLKGIYMHAFVGTGLSSIRIPGSVTYIGEDAIGSSYINKGDADTDMLDEFTVIGYSGGAAEDYANDENFAFISIGTFYGWSNLNDSAWKCSESSESGTYIEYNGPEMWSYSIDSSGVVTIGLADENSEEIFRAGIGDTPWMVRGDTVTKVVFEEGLTAWSLSGLFEDCAELTSVEGLSNVDTTNVTDMSSLFSGCTALTQLDVSGFDTANVTDMSSMFRDCGSLTYLDVTEFDTANVTDMGFMFNGCAALAKLDVTGFKTSAVTSMRFMFYDCESLKTLDLSSFDTTNVTDTSYMLIKCKGLRTLILGENFAFLSETADMSLPYDETYGYGCWWDDKGMIYENISDIPLTGGVTYTAVFDANSSTSLKAQKITIKKAQLKKTLKAKKLKKKKQSFKLKVSVKDNAKVTFSKVAGSKKITVNKNGKVTVKKGTKAGTYKVKVKIKAAKTTAYKAKTVTKTVKITVK